MVASDERPLRMMVMPRKSEQFGLRTDNFRRFSLGAVPSDTLPGYIGDFSFLRTDLGLLPVRITASRSWQHGNQGWGRYYRGCFLPA
jgi:hypothetical protein